MDYKMKNFKLKSSLVLFACLVLLASCGKIKEKNVDENQKVLKVILGQAKIEEANADSYYIGTVEASQTVPVSFSVPGAVEQVFVEEGQLVNKGQKIAELVSSSFKNSLQMAQSQEKQAKDAYDRLTKVYKEGSLPEIKYVEIESKLQQAVSSAQIAQKNVNDCIIKAPISGIVGRKDIEPGTNVMPSNPILSIYKIDDVLIKVAIPENEISSVKKGNKASIKIAALDNSEFNGTINEISMVANAVSHTYDAKILIRNNGFKIKPGMVCNVNLNNRTSKNVLSVPNSAIISEVDKKYVYVLNADGKTVSKKTVEIGNYTGNNIIIRNGITTEDKIVVVGQQLVYENANVTVIK
jgi:RND family efflux transporter MFP subunit